MSIRRRVTDAWLRDVRAQWGERAHRACTALVDVLARCQNSDLEEVGTSLARQGHRLDDVLAWLRPLAARSRWFGAALANGGIVALADGWAKGVLHDDLAASPVTQVEVLRLRMQQQFELATSRGRAPERELALVVVDTAGRHDCSARIADHARAAFGAAETMATAPNGNLLVLVRRTPETRVRTLRLIHAMRLDDQLRGAPARVWIEPLANAVEHVDSHLIGLAS